jgi:hypothetical protein
VTAGRIKGAVFREYVGWLARTLGQNQLDQIVSRVIGDARRTFATGQPHLGILAASCARASRSASGTPTTKTAK